MKGWVAALIVSLVIALCAGIGIGFYLWGESEAYDQGYNTGYSAGYYDGYDWGCDYGWDEGYSIGWDEGYSIGWSEGYAEPRPLRLFESYWELRSWILHDDTDNMTPIPETFDCDDFAMMLSQNAANDGYFIGLYCEKREGHMKNFAYIEGLATKIYLIEPQTDRTEPLWVD